MISETEPLKRRASVAIIVLVTNLILWVIIPSSISSFLLTTMPNFPLANTSFVLTFGAVITGLFVLGAITDGMVISVPMISGAYLASAFYVWEALEGGTLSFAVDSLSVNVSLGPLLFLAVLPLLFMAIRGPVEFLLQRSEAGLPDRELC
jgi:hypothetical protein